MLIALHFGANCSLLSHKSQFFAHLMAQQSVYFAHLCKTKWPCLHLYPTPFLHQINLRENRFFRAEGQLAGKKGAHNVKILTEKLTRDG